MAAANGPSKPVVVSPRSSGHRILLALLVATTFLAAVAGIVVTASMGQNTAALIIALVAGGSFSTILC